MSAGRTSVNDPIFREALKLLSESEKRLDQLGGDWGPKAGQPDSLVNRLKEFLSKHAKRRGSGT
jgi:hypothetical protein